jgi:UDP-N-acetylglucosamine--N-acetylmuramyl-(pentapeptide) pyrophosphoryl-undecaprenol N-acetylglucosamine transferase
MSEQKYPRPIMIAAGGTGGHVYPGLAVAKALEARGVRIVWMGTHKGLEARVIPAANIEMAWLNVTGLRGKGVLTLLMAPIRVMMALSQSLKIMLKYKPAAVLGMGGFVAGPGGLVAALIGKPLLIHEQNAVSGLTNRLLSRFAKQVLQAFPNTFEAAISVGNPVRKEIAAIIEPQQRLAKRTEAIRILIVGGSLGALALNQTVPSALALLTDEISIEVLHQAGKSTLDTAQQAYSDAAIEAEVTAYIEDMATVYTWADVVICRAGAMTISELAAAGVASILVPYPHAVDDHQTANAAVLADANAAILCPQATLTAESLAAVLQPLLSDRNKIMQMSCQARTLAKADATEQVADFCMQFAGYEQPSND